jgi:myo-inositol 2-dehydrogenase/D-chiro-inositol 1-dehydrogenase
VWRRNKQSVSIVSEQSSVFKTMKNENINRRDFLKNTSTAVAGSALLGTLALEQSVHAAATDTLKLALIGCGGRGTGAVSQAMSTSGPTKLVAMADVFKDHLEDKLGSLKKEHADKVDVKEDNQFIGWDAYKKAISTADVVILATPPGLRPIHFEEAVRQGKHVFMEKPVATDAVGVRRVLAAAQEAKKKNLKVGVGLQRRHQNCYNEAIKRLNDGAIGDIVAMRAYWDGSTPWVHTREELTKQYGRKLTEMEYQMRNWYYFNWLCGDHIVEQHIHNLDVINWIKGTHPVRAQGMGGCEVRKGPDYGEIFDHHFVEFEYADGSRLSSQCRHINGCFTAVSEHAVGTKGRVDLDNGGNCKITGENAWKFKKEKEPNPYQVEHDELFDAIRNDKPYNEADYGAISTMTAIFGRMATYSGKMIEWEDAINSNINLQPKEYGWDAEPPVKPGPDGLYPLAIPGKTEVVKLTPV